MPFLKALHSGLAPGPPDQTLDPPPFLPSAFLLLFLCQKGPEGPQQGSAACWGQRWGPRGAGPLGSPGV